MNDFEMDACYLCSFLTESKRYCECKEIMKKADLLFNKQKQLPNLLIFLLDKNIINCNDGYFALNKSVRRLYYMRYNRDVNFCIEFMKFFDDLL